MSHTRYRKQRRQRNRNTTLLLRYEDCDFTCNTRRRPLHPGRRVLRACRAQACRRTTPGSQRGREMEDLDWMVSAKTVVLLPAADSGDDPLCRPLLRCRRHAEGLGEIEMDGGSDRPLPVRNGRRRHPQPVEQRRGRWWPTSPLAGRVELRRGRQRPLVGPPEVLG